jgi:hypothetical protein
MAGFAFSGVVLQTRKLFDLQPKCVILNVSGPRKHRSFIVSRVWRQAEHEFISADDQLRRVKRKFVRDIVAYYGGAHSTRAAVVISARRQLASRRVKGASDLRTG